MDSPTALAACHGDIPLFTRNPGRGGLRRLTDPASGADNEDQMSVHSFCSDQSTDRATKLRHFQSVGASDSRQRVQLPLLAQQHQPAAVEDPHSVGGSSRDGHVRSWAEQQAGQSVLALPQLQINGPVHWECSIVARLGQAAWAAGHLAQSCREQGCAPRACPPRLTGCSF
jgi:hypothetical protein